MIMVSRREVMKGAAAAAVGIGGLEATRMSSASAQRRDSPVKQLAGGGKTAMGAAGITAGLRYGTGTPPAKGVSSVGTGFGSQQFFGAPSTSLNGQFALNGVITGLTPGPRTGLT